MTDRFTGRYTPYKSTREIMEVHMLHTITTHMSWKFIHSLQKYPRFQNKFRCPGGSNLVLSIKLWKKLECVLITLRIIILWHISWQFGETLMFRLQTFVCINNRVIQNLKFTRKNGPKNIQISMKAACGPDKYSKSILISWKFGYAF